MAHRAVIDTNVLFEGLARRGAAGAVIDAWVARRFTPCVSTALALEYEEVLMSKFGEPKRQHVAGALQALLDRAEFVPVPTPARPISPDPDDDMVIECALGARATIVTRNTRDFLAAEQALGLVVLTPEAFITRLGEELL